MTHPNSNSNPPSPIGAVTVLGWTVPRPTGRWHQAIVITSRHVWITPELSFTDNAALEAAATAGNDAFHDYVRGAGWIKRPPRCNVADVRVVKWDETTGWIRVGSDSAELVAAMIPDRQTGTRLTPLVTQAIAARITALPS